MQAVLANNSVKVKGQIRSPAGKGLTSWFLLVMFNCVFVTFPCGILGQVWYLILSIPHLYRLSYFNCCFEISPLFRL